MTDNVLHVYGASDDLLEVSGSVSDEFYPPTDEKFGIRVWANKEGHQTPVEVLLTGEYDDSGEWRLDVIRGHDLLAFTGARGEDAGDDEDGCPGYSDKFSVRGGISVELFSLDNTP